MRFPALVPRVSWKPDVWLVFYCNSIDWSSPDVGSDVYIYVYSLTRATLMSPGKDKTRVCGYVYIYTYKTPDPRYWNKQPLTS